MKKLFSTKKNRITCNGGRGAEGIVEFVSGEGLGVGGVAKYKGGAGAIGQINAILGGHGGGVEIFHPAQSKRAEVAPGSAFDFGKEALVVVEKIKRVVGHQQWRGHVGRGSAAGPKDIVRAGEVAFGSGEFDGVHRAFLVARTGVHNAVGVDG